MYSAHSGDPCYNATGFTVVGVHDGLPVAPGLRHRRRTATRWPTTTTQDTNYYGEDNGAQNVVLRPRLLPDQIDYGFTAGNAYGRRVPDKVLFGTGDRCVAARARRSAVELRDRRQRLPGRAVRPDLRVRGDAAATYAPTFFSTVRLTSITTQQYSAAAATYATVDTYALTQTEPATGDGTSPTLWLASITRTGRRHHRGRVDHGDRAATGVSFGGAGPGRTGSNTDELPGLYRYRIAQITTEIGAVTAVTYGTPDPCTDSYVHSMTTTAESASNTDSCFPVYWTPQGYDGADPGLVQQVRGHRGHHDRHDRRGADAQTDYTYAAARPGTTTTTRSSRPSTAPTGSSAATASVTTLTGDGVNDPQTEQVTTYYRGMSETTTPRPSR